MNSNITSTQNSDRHVVTPPIFSSLFSSLSASNQKKSSASTRRRFNSSVQHANSSRLSVQQINFNRTSTHHIPLDALQSSNLICTPEGHPEILESELGRLPRGPVPPTGSRPSQSEVARQWEHHPLIHIHHHVQIMEASSAGGSRTALAKCRGADGGRERGVEQQPSS